MNPLKKPLSYIQPLSWSVHDTQLPNELCDMLLDYFVDREVKVGTTVSNKGYRRCGMKWADPNGWVGPFLWKYIQEVNDRIFQYDIDHTYLTEIHQLEYRPGHYYHWHVDDDIFTQLQYFSPTYGKVRPDCTEYVRKLSFSLQLTDPSEYTGGDVQIVDDARSIMYTVPKERGTLCIFDSRTRHRVKPVKTGKRFVLVGWVLGPRWK